LAQTLGVLDVDGWKERFNNVNCMSLLVLCRTLVTVISLLYYKVCVISMS